MQDGIDLGEVDRKSNFSENFDGVASAVSKQLLDDIADVQARFGDAVLIIFSVALPESIRVEEDHWREVGRGLGIEILLAVLEDLPQRAAAAPRIDDTSARLPNESFFAYTVLKVLGIRCRQRRGWLGSKKTRSVLRGSRRESMARHLSLRVPC